MAGHVRKVRDGRPKPWLCTYQDAQGKRRAKSFVRKLDADRFLATVTVDVMRGDWIDPKDGRVTFGDYAARWIAERPIRDSTRAAYLGYYKHMRELHNVALGDLRPSTIRSWQAVLSARLAKSTARTIRGVAASILNTAVADRLISTSPANGVALPARPDKVLVYPYPIERVLALRDSITPRLAAAIVLGAGCGPRRGEAFGLTVDRVDFLRRTITFDRQVVGLDDGRPNFGPLKTRASSRVVPAPQSVLDALAAHLARFPAGPSGLIFTAPRGGVVTRSKISAAWKDAEVRIWATANGHPLGASHKGSDRGPNVQRIPAATQAAFDAAHPDGHGHRYHELRHFYASTLIADGQSVKVVQARLGHATAAETLDTYSHLWPDDEDRTRTAIDDVFAPKADESNGRATGERG